MVTDAAPFSTEQQLWLNGFLTGLAGARLHQAKPAVPAVARARLTILYGSQSGNCEALGRELRKKATAAGFAPQVAELDAFDRAKLAEVRHLLIVTSTFGEGDPPDNARKFFQWLLSGDAPQLPQLSYSVCALGDSNYTQFCKCGIVIDERLAQLGATRLAPRVECDVAYEDPFAQWKDAVFGSEALRALAASAPAVAVSDSAKPEPEEASLPAIGRGKDHPFPATLLSYRVLNLPGSNKQVHHVELSLAGSGLDYEPGDVLGVWPVNCADLVEEILSLAGFHGEETVEVKKTSMPLRAALLRHCDLTVIPKECYEHLVPPQADTESAPNGPAATATNGFHVVDLFARSSFRTGAQELVASLRPLQPRLYSISSSPRKHPGQVHLTVSAVRYETHGRSRKGVASTFLADRVMPGSTVWVWLQKASHFRLPEDDARPIIMIGPGTGVAPFRAFLEHRQARGAGGRNWLFFGDQHQGTDFLYREQLENLRAEGLLARLDTAFSRDQAERIYVQHRMIENGAELWEWLESGAHFYVCGDAKRMAKDVDAALHEIVERHGGKSPEEASDFVKRLQDEHRYQRDVY
jgi:sulfite reductase (NADPH) flavoprotein alpha-component